MVFVAACVVGGGWVALTAAGNEWPILGPVIMTMCAHLAAAGVLAARMGPCWLAAALVAVGALVIGTLSFWTIPASTTAIALIVLFVFDARRRPPVAARPVAS